jgi:hypothetical protein
LLGDLTAETLPDRELHACDFAAHRDLRALEGR